ncbi:MAG: APA family basic amino acid/polyamine antiporter, partial [Myxococcota bacterium]
MRLLEMLTVTLATMQNEPSASSHKNDQKLRRVLTTIPATSIIVAGVIGTGVFMKAKVMIVNVQTPGMVLLAYLLAGLLTMTGALVFSELSTMMPRSGGEFHYTGAAFGRRLAFLNAWTGFCARLSGTAAMSILTVVFLNDFLGGTLSPLALRLLPILLIAGVTILNLSSVRSMGWFSTMMTMIKIGLIFLISVIAFTASQGTWEFYSPSIAERVGEVSSDIPSGGLGGFSAAMMGALWSYSGMAYITLMAGEVKRPGHTLPRALMGSTLLIISLYLLINMAYFYALTPTEVANTPEGRSVAAMVIESIGAPFILAVMGAGLFLSSLGAMNTGTLTGSRLLYTLARKGLAPKTWGQLSHKSVPAHSAIVIGIGSSLMAATGSFDLLTD